MAVRPQRSHLPSLGYFVSMVKLYFKALRKKAESMFPLDSSCFVILFVQRNRENLFMKFKSMAEQHCAVLKTAYRLSINQEAL